MSLTPPPMRAARPSRAGRTPRVRHERRTLEMRDALKIVLVADTHSHPHPRSHALIEAERPDHILHGGDIGDLRVLDDLARIAPLTAVRGNIDARMPDLPDVVTIDVQEGATTRLRILLLHIAIAGTRLRADVARLATGEGASLVACGHSHVPFIGRDRDALVFNPGSIGPRRFLLPIVFGVLTLGADGLRMHHVSCETGQRWSP